MNEVNQENNSSIADEVLKFKKLLDENIITKEEFEKKKAELLNTNTVKTNTTNIEQQKINVFTKKKNKKETKPSTIIAALLIVALICVFANMVGTTEKSGPIYMLTTEYKLSQEEAEKVISIIKDCGYRDYYSNYQLEKSMDNKEIEGSIGFTIKSGQEIVGFVDIKDNAVCQIQYGDKILYQNGTIQHTLSEYLFTFDEESTYIAKTENVVKKILKSPSTAKFPWDYNEWGLGKIDGSVIIQGYVDSQNGFGATIRSNFQVTYINDTVTSLIFDGKEYIK